MIAQIETGLFNLNEFIGYPVFVVNKYFKEKAWQMIECFNDYKWVWVNNEIGKSIIAKVEIIDNETLGNEVIDIIYWYEGIYKET